MNITDAQVFNNTYTAPYCLSTHHYSELLGPFSIKFRLCLIRLTTLFEQFPMFLLLIHCFDLFIHYTVEPPLIQSWRKKPFEL